VGRQFLGVVMPKLMTTMGYVEKRCTDRNNCRICSACGPSVGIALVVTNARSSQPEESVKAW